MNKDRTETMKWWALGLALLVVTLGVLGVTGALGGAVSRWFGVKVERAVLVESHQYKEARNTEIATYEAQLAELRGQLGRPDLSEADRARIDGQITSINIMLTSARTK